MASRDDVVLVDFPYSDGGSKIRPALIIQRDEDSRRLTKTVIAMITGNLKRAHEPTHVLVDPSTTDGRTSGLRASSLVSCNNLYTIEQGSIIRTIGRLSPALMDEVDEPLRVALKLP